MNNTKTILKEMRKHYNKKNIEGMKRFGIPGEIGISVAELRKLGKQIGKNHKLAFKLWNTKIHEARLLACFVADPERLTEKEIEKMVKDFKSWDLCDTCCSNLIDKSVFAWDKVFEFTERKEEFVKRAGFALMATLAVHDKKSKDKRFLQFFPYIKKECTDERNYVKKAVNWALRQVGKKNLYLNEESIKLSEEILEIDDKTAQWIAKDALRELTDEKVQERLRNKK